MARDQPPRGGGGDGGDRNCGNLFRCMMRFAPFDILYMTWRDWAANTSVAGAGNASNADTRPRRCCWFVIFVAGLILTTVTLVHVIMAYYDYDITTTMTLKKYTNIPFPAVTVCNQNRVDCVRLRAAIELCEEDEDLCDFEPQGDKDISVVVDHLTELFSYACNEQEAGGGGGGSGPPDGGGDGGEGPPSPPTTRRRRKRETAPPGTGSRKQGGEGPPKQDSLGDISDEYEMVFVNKYMWFNENNRKRIGHEFDNIILDCTFKQRDCMNESNFWTSSVPSYGNCFSFNTYLSGDGLGGTRVASLTGPTYGLLLVLNIEQTKYMVNGLTKTAGARVSIHNEYNIPLMEEYGFNVMANTQNSMSIQEVAITRLKTPYTSECIDSWGDTNYTSYIPSDGDDTKAGWNYTLALCQRVCLLAFFNDECNCTHASYLDDDSNRINPACELTSNGQHYDCVNDIYNDLDLGLRWCDCSAECEETDYNISPSLGSFPSRKYEDLALDSYGFESDSVDNVMSENLLEVEIYFTSLNVQRIEEEEVYTSWYSSEFISALGGALSLYLGISIASFFELVEFFADLSANTYLYCFKGKRSLQKEGEQSRLGSAVQPVGPYHGGYLSPTMKQ